MKKFLSLLLALILVLSLAACGGNKIMDDAAQKANDHSPFDASSRNRGPAINTEKESNAAQENNDTPVPDKEVPPTEEEEPQTATRQGSTTAPKEDEDFSGKVDVTAATEKETPKDPAQTTTQSNPDSSISPENRAEQREDGVYDGNGNKIVDATDPAYVPTQEEVDIGRELAYQNLVDLVKAGQNPIDNGYVIWAADTGRYITSEEWDSFIKVRDPFVDDYLDSEHEQGLY